MTDKYGNILNTGDTIITTVSKNSHYLTLAKILNISEQNNKVLVMFYSTPKNKWIDKNLCMKVEEKYPELIDDSDLCKDCSGNVLNVGDKVIFRTDDGFEKDGIITEIISKLWATVNNNIKLRNVSLYKL